MMCRMLQWLLVTLMFVSTTCLAHKQSDSYLTLSVNGQSLAGQWDIALRDLDFAIGLDADENGQITWGEVRRRRDAIAGTLCKVCASARMRVRPAHCAPERC